MPSIQPPPQSAVPATYRTQDQQRKRFIASGLAALLLALGSCTVFLVTQPMSTSKPSVPIMEVDGKALEHHVRQLSEGGASRDWFHPKGLATAAEYIARHFQESGGRRFDQSFQARGKDYTNVCTSFGPESGPRIIIGAHYDVCGDRPGADDNASGVAGLLELARLLSKKPPAQRVDLVAYTLEEPPFFRSSDMGSAHHALLMKETGADVKAVVVLEMIGRFTDGKNSQSYPSVMLEPFYPDTGNFISIVGRFSDIRLTRNIKASMRAASQLPVQSMNGPRWIPGLDFSDHHPYWDQGFSAVMVTDTAFYRNKDYHTVRDTADRLDYTRMSQVVQGVYGAVTQLANQSN